MNDEFIHLYNITSYERLKKSLCIHESCPLSCRDLDARAKSERYRTLFRLPKDEKLDGHTDCTLWTPFNKMHILGQMFVSTNYICFTSKEETLCSLIIPLREAGYDTEKSRSESGEITRGIEATNTSTHTSNKTFQTPSCSSMHYVCARQALLALHRFL